MKNLETINATINEFFAMPMHVLTADNGERFICSDAWYGKNATIEVWEKKNASKGVYGYDVCISYDRTRILGGLDMITAKVADGTKVVSKYEKKAVVFLRGKSGQSVDDELIDFMQSINAIYIDDISDCTISKIDLLAMGFLPEQIDYKEEAVAI